VHKSIDADGFVTETYWKPSDGWSRCVLPVVSCFGQGNGVAATMTDRDVRRPIILARVCIRVRFDDDNSRYIQSWPADSACRGIVDDPYCSGRCGPVHTVDRLVVVLGANAGRSVYTRALSEPNGLAFRKARALCSSLDGLWPSYEQQVECSTRQGTSAYPSRTAQTITFTRSYRICGEDRGAVIAASVL